MPAQRVHPLGRLCFSLGLFISVAMTHGHVAWLCALLAGCVLLLRLQQGLWQPVLRASRLLLWLLIPILLLHLLFTPGSLLWPGSILPFTREGWQQGAWLALHLCTLFFAAMLLSRSLQRGEWVYYCLHLPVLGRHLLPYVRLAVPMRTLAGRVVSEVRLKARLDGGWRNAPRMLRALGDMVTQVWQEAPREACGVWDAWESSSDMTAPAGRIVPAVAMALAGLLLPLTILGLTA